ncbi:hypothetical protein AHAS_Ahas03G0193200 [Arachis hypogaea]
MSSVHLDFGQEEDKTLFELPPLHDLPVDFLFLHDLPVYALSNPWEEFLLVARASTGKHLDLFYFNEDDAQALLR